MDRITASMVDAFSAENGIQSLPESDRFEHFASYSTVRSLFDESFDTGNIVLGDQATGIDAIAIIVNDVMIGDLDEFVEINEKAAGLDVTFCFVQADTSKSFDIGKMGNFAFAVRDFFKDSPQLPRSEDLADRAKIQAAIYKAGSKFKKANPRLHLFYVTTGQLTGDQTLEARRQAEIDSLKSENIFSSIEFECVGAADVQKLYRQAKNAIAKEFVFQSHVAMPEIPGVTQAYLGFMPAIDFLSVIRSDDGEIARGIFESNVRDFQNYNSVNSAMATTLETDERTRFVLMNNGVTIITRSLTRTGTNKFHIEDFQIVNGCQTSNVLFDNSQSLSGVNVPLRLIHTDDENIIQSIVTATNSQTQVTREQLLAITEFPKKLEQFFQSYDEHHRLYYERRPKQYERTSIDRSRMITQPNTIRAFAGMFRGEPHRTTKNFNALVDQVGKEIFSDRHRLEPYYVAAYALCRLEKLFKSKAIDSKFKAARFQMLFAFRRLCTNEIPPEAGSRDMVKYCDSLLTILWDDVKSTALFEKARDIVVAVTANNLGRDNIRTLSVTNAIEKYEI